jgi:hypothetical protein
VRVAKVGNLLVGRCNGVGEARTHQEIEECVFDLVRQTPDVSLHKGISQAPEEGILGAANRIVTGGKFARLIDGGSEEPGLAVEIEGAVDAEGLVGVSLLLPASTCGEELLDLV